MQQFQIHSALVVFWVLYIFLISCEGLPGETLDNILQVNEFVNQFKAYVRLLSCSF